MDTETRLNGRTDGERHSTLGHGAYSQIIAVALLGIIVSFLLFGIIRHQTLENNRLRYLDAADTQQRIISHAINSNVEGLFDLYYPFALFPDIGWTDFQVMARAVLQHHPDMQAVEWVPRVTKLIDYRL